MVGAPRERQDRQVGALAGRQGTHLTLDPQCPSRVERRHAERIRGQPHDDLPIATLPPARYPLHRFRLPAMMAIVVIKIGRRRT